MIPASATIKSGRPRIKFEAGQKIRVLVVDDSVVVRRLVTHALADDAEVEVVGSAASADLALQKIPLLKPDLLTLDINMPGMSGLDLLLVLREQYPAIHVIMCSTLTVNNAPSTLEALMRGASDYVTKSPEAEALESSLIRLRTQILVKIKQLFYRTGEKTGSSTSNSTATASYGDRPIPKRSYPRPERSVLAIGISTGGPAALATLMAGFPLDFSLPIVIVQHMPPVFTRLLAERLRSLTGFNVVEASPGMILEPGKAIIAPGGYHMRLARSGEQVRVTLDQEAQECSCRPSVDVLFRSVNQVYGRTAIAAVLTGMGQDGLRGVGEMKKSGAYLIAQDEASSVVWGMPGAIVNAGLADEVLDLSLIVSSILKQVGN